MHQIKKIFIVGHAGAGKRVLAEAVAESLGWQCLDADFALEATMGRPLEEVLGSQGSQQFQNRLTEIMAHQVTQQQVVVTTDESLVLSEQARHLLSQEFTVYLKVSTKTQLSRLAPARPLLPVKEYSDLLQTMHQQRDQLYAQVASLTLNSDENALEKHVAEIVHHVKMSNAH